MSIRNIRFVLFNDFKHLNPDPELIFEMHKQFLSNGVQVIPGTFQQMNPQHGLKTYERILFNNSKENVTIQIGIEALEISKVINSKKHYVFENETDEFLTYLKKVITSLHPFLTSAQPAKRCSLIVDNIYIEAPLKDLSDIYKTFNNTIDNYSEEETFEWNTRAVKKIETEISNYQEVLNFVTEIMRTSGQINQSGNIEEIDTIQTRIDFNTIDTNKNARINDEFIFEFLDLANREIFSKLSELEVKILERN